MEIRGTAEKFATKNIFSERITMNYQAMVLKDEHVPFVATVFEQNKAALHGGTISLDEWRTCLCATLDPDELNFIIATTDEPVAWLKLNGLNGDVACVSMLVVAKEHQQRGVGSFALDFAEQFARRMGKHAVYIQTTRDNAVATTFYLHRGYRIAKEIRYAVGDGIVRDGYQFCKSLEESV